MIINKPTSPATTATVTVEVNYKDGSKNIIKSVELDASQLPSGNQSPDAPSRLIASCTRPFEQPTWEDRTWYGSFYDGMLRSYAGPEFFSLNLQLQPVKPDGHLYTVTHVEPPMTEVVMRKSWSSSVGLKIVDLTVEQAAEVACQYTKDIFFVLEVPS